MTTLRLNMPQWQGGNDPGYHLGSRLLSFLAPEAKGPVETVAVPPPVKGENLSLENGVVARGALLAQARAARLAILKHNPDRIVTLGGDCLVNLAPTAWLSEKYGSELGVLWIDSHPDVMRPEHYPHAHAYVLGLLLGQGDNEFRAEVRQPVDPGKVIYAGLDKFMPHESKIIEQLGLKRVGSDELSNGSAPVVEWIRSKDIRRLAVHFDLDSLDPAHFRPLIFNKPGLPDSYAEVPRGRLLPAQVVRLLKDVSAVTDIVGIAIAEHMPWDMIAMQDTLAELPLMNDC